jgi:hypothetical protein
MFRRNQKGMSATIPDFLDALLERGCSGTFEATREVYRFFPWIGRIEAARRVKEWEAVKKLKVKGLTTTSTHKQDASDD